MEETRNKKGSIVTSVISPRLTRMSTLTLIITIPQTLRTRALDQIQESEIESKEFATQSEEETEEDARRWTVAAR